MSDRDIAPEQSRAARAYLGWERRDLAARSGVHVDTILYFENRSTVRHKVVRTKPETRAKIRRAFEDAGVEFVGRTMLLPWTRIAGP